MLSVLITSLFVFGSPELGARLQMGEQVATYRIDLPRAHRFPTYANNGFSQSMVRLDGVERLQVKVRNRPLASKVPGRPVSPLPAELAELEARLNRAASGYLADQVVVLFTWLRANITYIPSGEGDQELAGVLASRSANCVGLANLSLLVLKHMGVQARSVTGLAFKDQDASLRQLEGDALHRWIEVHYEDVGWVFCDPAGKVNFVEATYIVLGIDQVHGIPQAIAGVHGGKVQLLHFRNEMRTVAHDPEVDSRLRIRPNRLFQKH